MDSNQDDGDSFVFTDANIKRLKEKYSNEMKNEQDNPVKLCMRLVFEAATERDKTKQSQLAFELSQFLTQPGGVFKLFITLIDFDSSSEKVTTLNQRFIAIASIISRLPKLCMPFDQYCANIFGQISILLGSVENENYSTLACIVVKSLLESEHNKGLSSYRAIIEPTTKALIQPDPSFPIHKAITVIHNLLVNHISPKLFVDSYPQLFVCYILLRGTSSNCEKMLKSCLFTIMHDLKPGQVCCMIEKTLLYNRDIYDGLYEKYLSECGLSIRFKSQVQSDIHDSSCIESISMTQIVDAVLELVSAVNSQSLVLEFFFHFTQTMWSSRDDDSRLLSGALVEPLLSKSIQESAHRLDVLTIIANKIEQSLQLISRMLLNYVEFLRCNEGDFESRQKLVQKSMDSCLDILDVLMISDVLSGVSISGCLSAMKQLKDIYSDSAKSHPSLYNRIKELHSKMTGEAGKVATSIDEENDLQNDKSIDEIETVIRDLNDKLLPVRVHALIRLKQLILAKDSCTLSKIEHLYNMVESTLADPEPYVFLTCINLVSEMAVTKTPELLPKLTCQYLNSELQLQQRINIGEVLVRVIKQLNATTPFYAQQVVDILLKAANSQEELIRCSSLTNLGEICRNLGDSLGKFITEIIACVESVLLSDTIQVKCAAVDLLRTTLAGQDSLKVESIQTQLKTIYDLMKQTKSRTFDDNLCLQLDLAMQEIDRLARQLLNLDLDRNKGTNKLEKNIQLMSLLDK